MDQERYDLVFSGDLVPGFELSQVKLNLQGLFRIDKVKVEQLFAGRPTVLKKGLDLDAATKYRTAMKKAGARLELVANAGSGVSGDSPAPEKAGSTISEAVEPRPGISSKGEGTSPKWSSELGAQPLPPKTPRPAIEAPDFGIAAPGANLLNPDETPKVVPVSIDLEGLAVVEQTGNLLRPEERGAPPAAKVRAPEFDVMPPGSDLNPSDKLPLPELELDLSGFELAPPGARLEPPKAEAPKPPAVDHLTLQK